MNHYFRVEIAQEYGLSEAILLENINYWIVHNEANGTNYYDGTYWTYNSARAFAELFPYLSARKIRTALKNLEDLGIIKTGNYNANAYDRTLWYALTEKGKCIMQKCKMEIAKNENGLDENVTPIPLINTDIKPTINSNSIGETPNTHKNGGKEKQKRFSPPSLDEVKEYCKERKNNIEPQQFIDYYTARGWELSKGRKVKDWKACIRTWERNGYDTPKAETQTYQREDTGGETDQLAEWRLIYGDEFVDGIVARLEDKK